MIHQAEQALEVFVGQLDCGESNERQDSGLIFETVASLGNLQFITKVYALSRYRSCVLRERQRTEAIAQAGRIESRLGKIGDQRRLLVTLPDSVADGPRYSPREIPRSFGPDAYQNVRLAEDQVFRGTRGEVAWRPFSDDIRAQQTQN